jgi:2-polyprenyl-3-methyl-5-hydroxy-6-metoxy-1,4-benzoquinol methylase
MSDGRNSGGFDPRKAEEFSSNLLAILNDAGLALMISVGHRTGLFDRLRGLGPATVEEIAQKTGLNERYVREWLGAMVTGRVIEADPEGRKFSLPEEHGAFLTRDAGADNLAVFAQYIAVLGSVEDAIVECFRSGGGVPYEKFPRFHEVMSEDSGQSVLSSLETHILRLVPGLVDKLQAGIDVLDVGCGRGRILNRLAELFPNSRFIGIDLSREAILFARQESAAKKLRNVEFRTGDLSDFDAQASLETFDLITTFDAVHDQAKPLSVLRGIYRALKANGVYLMQDIKGSCEIHKNMGHPLGPLLYTVSCMHCMTVSLAQGGEGLGAMWGEEKTLEYLERAGFSSVEKHELAHDIQNNWYVVRK